VRPILEHLIDEGGHALAVRVEAVKRVGEQR
jgi:hypothetical protein